MSVRSEKRPFLRSLLVVGMSALTFGSLGLGMSAFTAFADDEQAEPALITGYVRGADMDGERQNSGDITEWTPSPGLSWADSSGSDGVMPGGAVQLMVTASNHTAKSMMNPSVCVVIPSAQVRTSAHNAVSTANMTNTDATDAVLAENPTLPEGWTARYSTDSNACQTTPHTEDASSDTPAGTPVLWGDTLPEDLATVKAVEVRAPLLAEGDSASIAYKMILPNLANYADQVFWWNPTLSYQEASETSRVAVVGEAVGVGAVGDVALPSGGTSEETQSKGCLGEQGCALNFVDNRDKVIAMEQPLVKVEEPPQSQESSENAAIIRIQDADGKAAKKASAGQKLVALPIDWPAETEFTLQWYIVNPITGERTAIKGATGATLTVLEQWAGNNIEVEATGTVNSEVYATAISQPVAVPDKAPEPVKQANAAVGSLAQTGVSDLLVFPAAMSMFGLGAAAYAVRCRRG